MPGHDLPAAVLFMKTCLTCLLLFIATLLPGLVAAQAPDSLIIIGQVRDAATGEPLPNAIILTQPLVGQTVADLNGRYRLKLGAVPGSLSLRFRLLGYKEAVRPVIVTKSQQTIDIHLEADSSGRTSAEVTLEVARPMLTRIDKIEPVEAYRRDYLQSFANSGIYESLRLIPGVQAQNLCSVCGTGEIRINGLDGPYTLVTIDGIPLMSALGSVYGLTALPSAMVQEVELQRGPGSVAYGSEAIAGVVNIKTLAPALAPRLLLDTWHDSYGQHQTDVAVTSRSPKLASLLGINAYNFNTRHDVNNDKFLDFPLLNRYSVYYKADYNQYNAANKGSVFARYLYENRLGGQDWASHQERGQETVYSESIYTRRIELAGSHQFMSNQRLYAWYGYSRHHQNSWYGTTNFNATQHNGFVQLMSQQVSANKRHQFMAGAALRLNGYIDNTVLSFDSAARRFDYNNTWLPGLLAEYTFNARGRASAVLASRLDYSRVHGPIWSPRVSLRHRLNEDHTLRAGAGSGFRIVNLFTEEHAALTGSRRVLLPRSLQPERSLTAYAQHDAHFHTGAIEWTSELGFFYTRIFDKILPDFSQPNAIIYANIDGYSQSRGLFAQLTGQYYQDLELVVGASLLRASSHSPELSGDLYYAPRARTNALLTWRTCQNKLKLTYGIEYTGRMRQPVLPNDYRPEYSPGYFLHDLQVTYAHPRSGRLNWEVYGGVRNLFNYLPRYVLMRPEDPFDKTAADPVTNPNSYTFDTGYNYASMMTRRLLLGVRLKVNG